MSTATTTRNFARGIANTPATAPQVTLLQALVTEIAAYDRPAAMESWELYRTLQAAGTLTLARAKHEITTLIAAKAVLRRNAAPLAAPVEERPQVPEGRYAVDTDESHLGFYRVSVSETGHYTVYVYASDAQHALPWKTAQSVLCKIEAFGAEAAGARFGVESKTCYKCGRKLTREHTRAAGIGDDCAKR